MSDDPAQPEPSPFAFQDISTFSAEELLAELGRLQQLSAALIYLENCALEVLDDAIAALPRSRR